MPGTKPKLVESSNPLQMELSRWETDGGAARDPPDDRFRMEVSAHTLIARESLATLLVPAQTSSRNGDRYLATPGPYATLH